MSKNKIKSKFTESAVKIYLSIREGCYGRKNS